jgi:hypothetical protein
LACVASGWRGEWLARRVAGTTTGWRGGWLGWCLAGVVSGWRDWAGVACGWCGVIVVTRARRSQLWLPSQPPLHDPFCSQLNIFKLPTLIA